MAGDMLWPCKGSIAHRALVFPSHPRSQKPPLPMTTFLSTHTSLPTILTPLTQANLASIVHISVYFPDVLSSLDLIIGRVRRVVPPQLLTKSTIPSECSENSMYCKPGCARFQTELCSVQLVLHGILNASFHP